MEEVKETISKENNELKPKSVQIDIPIPKRVGPIPKETIPREPPQKVVNEKNKITEEVGNFSLLLIFNANLEIVELINFSNRLLKDNIFSENLFYVELEEELFFEIQSLIRSNKLKLTKNPIKEKIGIGDIEKTPLPPKPPTPAELTNKAILEQTMDISGLNKKTQGLATGMMESVINQNTLEKKVNVLSKALLEITMKGMN